MEAILSFLAQVTAASRSSAAVSEKGTDSPVELRSLPFAQPGIFHPHFGHPLLFLLKRLFPTERVKALVQTAIKSIKEKLPPVASILQLYLSGVQLPYNHKDIISTLLVAHPSCPLFVSYNPQSNHRGIS